MAAILVLILQLYILIGIKSVRTAEVDYQEKTSLIRRISSGRLFDTVLINDTYYKAQFQDPSLDLLQEADFIYQHQYDTCLKDRSIMTMEEAIERSKHRGLWSDALETELSELDVKIPILVEQLEVFQFQKIKKQFYAKELDKATNRKSDLIRQKHALSVHSLEHKCEMAKRRFIIRQTAKVYNANGEDITIGLLEANQNNLSILLACYYEKNGLDGAQIREIARSMPWRMYWMASKNTSTPLWSHPLIEMTELQQILMQWTMVYDFAFESQNSPSDAVLDNDDAFDKWYEKEQKRIRNERNTDSKPQMKNGLVKSGVSRQEVFYMADREGAKEVYEMNDQQMRNNIKQRQNVLKDKGPMSEVAMPDIQRELKMEALKGGG